MSTNQIQLEKIRLRKIFKEKRMSLSKSEVASGSHQISQNFIRNLLPKILTTNPNKVFSLYLPYSNEVRTDNISEYFQKNHIPFSYPKILSKVCALDFILFENNQMFSGNKFFPKLLEPDLGTSVVPTILVVPLVSFDRSLSRLGMGGGFFDRTIESIKRKNFNALSIGLAYDLQRSNEPLPTENSDQRLDFIVTEKEVFSAS